MSGTAIGPTPQLVRPPWAVGKPKVYRALEDIAGVPFESEEHEKMKRLAELTPLEATREAVEKFGLDQAPSDTGS